MHPVGVDNVRCWQRCILAKGSLSGFKIVNKQPATPTQKKNKSKVFSPKRTYPHILTQRFQIPKMENPFAFWWFFFLENVEILIFLQVGGTSHLV